LEEGETERGEETDLPQTNDNVLLDQIGLGAGRDLDGESREDTLDVGCVDGDLQRQRTRTENKQLSSSLVLMGGWWMRRWEARWLTLARRMTLTPSPIQTMRMNFSLQLSSSLAYLTLFQHPPMHPPVS
jgi:hypothetical protein